MSISRLSDQAIENLMHRPFLYRRLIAYVADSENVVIEYEVKADEETNPELLAFRLYGNGDLRWLVGIMCSVTDEFASLPVGYVVKFPPSKVIASTIREVRDIAS